jgi:hypothetical protein
MEEIDHYSVFGFIELDALREYRIYSMIRNSFVPVRTASATARSAKARVQKTFLIVK